MNITYALVTSLSGLNPGETAFKLSTGDFVAVSVRPGRNCAPDTFAWCATGRALNADGTPELDHNGQPIVVQHHASCPKLALVSGAENSKALAQRAIDELMKNEDGIAAHIAASRAYKAGV